MHDMSDKRKNRKRMSTSAADMHALFVFYILPNKYTYTNKQHINTQKKTYKNIPPLTRGKVESLSHERDRVPLFFAQNKPNALTH